MKKEDFEQYADIKAEIQQITAALRKPVMDTVQASAKDFPYNPQSVTIQGMPPCPPRKAERLEKLKRQKEYIEAFSESLTISKQRTIAEMVMEYGTPIPWNQIAAELGHRYTAGKARYWYNKIWK